MKIRLTAKASIAGALLVLATEGVFGCGLDWSVPRNHFNGVNSKGCVSYWEKAGEVSFADDLKLPIIINFASDRDSSSPYLGRGWMIPLFESRFEQVSENNFRMIQPDGWTLSFSRPNQESNVLDGGSVWKAEINGNVISVSAACGWHLTYKAGHLVNFVSPHGNVIELIYSDGRVSSVEENGKNVVEVKISTDTPRRCTIFNRSLKVVEFQCDDVPVVKHIGGSVVLAARSSGLSSVKTSGNLVHTYSATFGEDSGLMRLQIKDESSPENIAGNLHFEDRDFSWDPVSRRIRSDNRWKYSIDDGGDEMAALTIKRTNDKDQSEGWCSDAGKGLTIERLITGKTITTTRFVSGILAGRLRKIEESDQNKVKTVYRAAYDEKGSLIRREDYGYVETIVYSGDGIQAIDRLGNGLATISKERLGEQVVYTLAKTGHVFRAVVDKEEHILSFEQLKQETSNPRK